jgi:hypothetical protein
MEMDNFTIIDRLKYRWEYCCNPLPGETHGTIIPVWRYDAEPIILLRRLRALLFGYGHGWTFIGAMANFLFGV